MNQLERIASDDDFLRMYQEGVSRMDLARYFGVTYRVINNVIEFMGLMPVNKNDLAPTPEEEKYSRENLMLAPSIYEAAEQFRQRYISRKEAETRESTYNKVWRWDRR